MPAVLPADLDQVDNVLVVEQLKNPDLSEGSNRKSLLFSSFEESFSFLKATILVRSVLYLAYTKHT